MIHTYTYKDVSWIDLECPTRDEVREVMKTYDIHPLAAEELLLPTTRSKVDIYDDFIYLILHFPAWKNSHRDTTQEVDFIVGKKFIVTARYATVDALHKFAKMFEVNSILDKNSLVGKNAGYMFYYMMREMYHSLSNELESVHDSLEDIEKKTFTGKEKEMVYEISNTSREILAFKHATALHGEVLTSFAGAAKPFFGAEFDHYIEAVQSECTKVQKAIFGLSESLSEMRETNSALLETKQNEIMKIFTAVTVISSVTMIIFNWFLVEGHDTPFAESPHEFLFVGIVGFVVALAFALVMKAKKWL